MFNENLDGSPHYDNKFNFPDEGDSHNKEFDNFYSKASNFKQLQLQDLEATEKVLKVFKESHRTDGPFLNEINSVLNYKLPLLSKELIKQIKEEQETQLKHKFNNLLANALVSNDLDDLKRLHRILDLVEVHDYSICKRPLDQHIWYNKNKIEELYQEQPKTTSDIL